MIRLILGGVRSGKSVFAEQLTLQGEGRPLYIATARILDEDMRKKIQIHQERRGQIWSLREAPLNLVETLEHVYQETAGSPAILVDCLTLWLNNVMFETEFVEQYCAEFLQFLEHISKQAIQITLVANEVGFGIIPEHRSARQFQEYAGRLNQAIAAIADQVYLIVAALPLKLKG